MVSKLQLWELQDTYDERFSPAPLPWDMAGLMDLDAFPMSTIGAQLDAENEMLQLPHY